MALSFKPKFKPEEIRKLIEDRFNRIEKAVLMRLQRVGETFINDARRNGNYTDRTGNLRSSIGYVILKNGQQYAKGGFETVKGGNDGRSEGQQVINDITNSYPTGLVLIVVAGMDYASAVESKGKDVLTGSSQTAVTELKRAMERISKKIDSL